MPTTGKQRQVVNIIPSLISVFLQVMKLCEAFKSGIWTCGCYGDVVFIYGCIEYAMILKCL